MRILVDTHAFLWARMDPKKLSGKVRVEPALPGNEVFVSVMTFWEISLKCSLGKLELRGITPLELPGVAEVAGFQICPLDPSAAASYFQLPRFGHKDPFDRMLIWQAIQSSATLVSKDSEMMLYAGSGLKVLW